TCVELGLDFASQPAYRGLVKGWIVPPKRMSLEATVAFVRQSCMSYLHPVGTCAMGSDREAVVDAELRVRGIEGLRIADASVMPTIPSANTNADLAWSIRFEQEDGGVGAVQQATRDNATSRPGADDHVVVISGERLAGLSLAMKFDHGWNLLQDVSFKSCSQYDDHHVTELFPSELFTLRS